MYLVLYYCGTSGKRDSSHKYLHSETSEDVTSVNTNMTLQINVCLELHATVRTVIWSSVAVNTSFMCVRAAFCAETFVAHWTREWFLFRVDSHVIIKLCTHSKSLATQLTFVQFVSRMGSHVSAQPYILSKRLVTHVTFVSAVYSHVFV